MEAREKSTKGKKTLEEPHSFSKEKKLDREKNFEQTKKEHLVESYEKLQRLKRKRSNIPKGNYRGGGVGRGGLGPT